MPNCRHCKAELKIVVADLGATPIANDFLTAAQRDSAEPFYPLRAYVCSSCRLVQLQDFVLPTDVFREDYAYASSFSTSWLRHAKRYVDEVQQRFRLDAASMVVEIASNDGYLLQYFMERHIPVLGVEPCASVAEQAKRKGVPTRVEFFGRQAAQTLRTEAISADLVVANNVAAHVADINDFLLGVTLLLKRDGVATFEFQHLLELMRLNEFDTIYHEHFSYFSLLAAQEVFRSNGLRIFDVEQLSTHGGSLRVFACLPHAPWEKSPKVNEILASERAAGLGDDEVYAAFGEHVKETKRSLLRLLIDLKRQGKSIVAYGAPAKGNTLLNYCGIGTDMLDFAVDRSPLKQGKYLPGSRLEIKAPEAIDGHRPDYILILPWNLKDEVVDQLAHVGQWGCQFIVPIPVAKILSSTGAPTAKVHVAASYAFGI